MLSDIAVRQAAAPGARGCPTTSIEVVRVAALGFESPRGHLALAYIFIRGNT